MFIGGIGLAELSLLAPLILFFVIIIGISFAIRFVIRSAKEKKIGQIEVADEIKKLAELHEQGVLTDEEFNEQKMKLLRKL